MDQHLVNSVKTRQDAWVEHHKKRGPGYEAILVCERCAKEHTAWIVPESNQARPKYCGLKCRREAAYERRKAL